MQGLKQLNHPSISLYGNKELSTSTINVIHTIWCSRHNLLQKQPLSYQGDMLQIRVWGRSEDKLKKCVDDIKTIVGSDVTVTAYPILSEAVSGADVVATVTMSSEPVLHGEWLKSGALVCCKYLAF